MTASEQKILEKTMTASEQKILEKTITKAVAHGWNKRGFDSVEVVTSTEEKAIQGIQMSYAGEEELSTYLSIPDLIYAHDFAKSLWGDVIVCTSCGRRFSPGVSVCTAEECILKDHDIGELPNWAYHLQHMVIQENPVDYLANN